MLFRSHISFFLVRDEIEYLVLTGMFNPFSHVNFNDSEQDYGNQYHDYGYERTCLNQE
jgi:hypothetical protein